MPKNCHILGRVDKKNELCYDRRRNKVNKSVTIERVTAAEKLL